ncbi:ABC transporter substrate-binding protein [Virgibacillus dakarensis]|uniref:ABC transporter substrate-binding protein n=1 Tax=Virgibacillus dakarensis TaxID=1917889 RepID=UPI000B446676|nr:sugar ABC transporter substrate-binding protein [Virgibacillus dakarensis]
MKKYLVLTISIFMIVGFLLSGCKSDKASQSNGNDVVTLTFWNRLGSGKTYFPKLIKDFEEKHPNIKIELTNVTGESMQAQYQAAIADNKLPDIFVRPQGFSVAQLVKLDQLHNLDEIFPEDVRKDYVEGTFNTGTEKSIMLDGSVYQFPMYSGTHGATMLWYNKDVLESAGIKDGAPETWDEMIEIGKKIYDSSNGDKYGLIVAGKTQWLNSEIIRQMSTEISPESEMNFFTGQYNFDTKGIVESMELFKELLDEKVMSPVSLEIDVRKAQALFSAGKAAFFIDGNWAGQTFVDEEKFENWGVAPLPTKEKDARSYRLYAGGVGEGIEVAKYTEHWPEVKLFLEYLRDNIYSSIVEVGDGAPALELEKIESVELPFPQYKDITEIMKNKSLVVPIAAKLNPNVIDVKESFSRKAPHKNIGTILDGYLTGQISDLHSELEQMTDEYNKVFNELVKEAGDKVSKEDFIFPNWDPRESYTEEDYQELKEIRNK